MTARETDPTLHRIERDTRIVCVVFALIALATSGWRFDAPLGVLAGGVLIGVSYWAIKAGVDGLTLASAASQPAGDRATPLCPRRVVVWMMVKFIARYALLAVIAYVMIARLRLHPLGLLAGVSSVVAAVAIETIRALTGPRAPS